jgi:hypothetical protein
VQAPVQAIGLTLEKEMSKKQEEMRVVEAESRSIPEHFIIQN